MPNNIEYITSQDNVKDLSDTDVINPKSTKSVEKTQVMNDELECLFDEFIANEAKSNPEIINTYKNNPKKVEKMFNLKIQEDGKNNEILQGITNIKIELNELNKEITESLYEKIEEFQKKSSRKDDMTAKDITSYVLQGLTYEEAKKIKEESDTYGFSPDAEIIRKMIDTQVDLQPLKIFDRTYTTKNIHVGNSSLWTVDIGKDTIINLCNGNLSDISILKHLVCSPFLHEPQNKTYLDLVTSNIQKILDEGDQYFFSYICEKLEKNSLLIETGQKNVYKQLLDKVTVMANKEYIRSRSDVCFLGHCFTAQGYFGLNDDKVNRIAKTGRFTFSLYDAIEKGIKKEKQEITTILDKSDTFIIDIGINDLSSMGMTATQVEEGIYKTMKMITDYKRKQKNDQGYEPHFIIFNITPYLGHTKTEGKQTETEREKYNEFLKRGINGGIKFDSIDVATLFEDKENPGYLDKKYDGGDKLHMKASAYNKYLELIVAKLKSTEKANTLDDNGENVTK